MRTLAALFIVVCSVAASAAPFEFRGEQPLSAPEYGPVRNGVYDPAIATDGETFLSVWTDRRAGGEPGVYASRLRADGSLIDATGVRIAPWGHTGGVVWTGTKYLIAFDEEPAGRTLVRTMTRDGVLGDPVEVSLIGGSRFGSMATNGTNVILVFDREAVLLDLEGKNIRTLALPNPDGYYQSRVAVAGSTYLIAAGTSALTVQTVSASGELGDVRTLADLPRYSKIGLASDGQHFLVVWPNGKLVGKVLAGDGSPITGTRELAAVAEADSPNVVWRGGEYLVTFSDWQSFGFYAVRVAADATALDLPRRGSGDLHRPQNRVAAATLGASGIAIFDGMKAALFDDASVHGGAIFRDPFDVAVAANAQTDVHLARRGAGYVAAWEENDAVLLSAGAGATPVVVRGARGPIVDVLVDDARVIWVLTGGERWVSVVRFTQALEPIDEEPLIFQYDGTALAAAAGGGAVAIAWSIAPPSETEQTDLAAMILRQSGSGVVVSELVLTRAQYGDRSPSLAFDGGAFVFAWVHDVGPWPEWQSPQPAPDSVIFAARVSMEGGLLDATPIVIAHQPMHVSSLRAARGKHGVALAWQTIRGEHHPLPHPTSTLATLFTIDGTEPIRDLGGEGTALATLEDHENGFLLVRGFPASTPSLTTVEYLTLGADLAVTGSGMLPPYEADHYWDPFDIDALGGSSLLFAYARSANEPQYGRVSRLFIRSAVKSTARRRAVR